MATLGKAVWEGSKVYAGYYQTLSGPGKVAFAMGTTAISPVFWIALVIIVLVVSVFLFLYSPCWIRNVKDPQDQVCGGWAPAGYFRALLMSLITIIIPFFLIFSVMVYLMQESSTKVIGLVSGDPKIESDIGKTVSTYL